MPAQAFLTTVAGLSVSLAGFASLIAWLRVDPTTWDPMNLWRVKTIVRDASTLTFLALLLVPVHELTGDTPATIRVGASLMVLFALTDMARNRHRDPLVWPPPSWGMYMAANSAFVGFQLVDVGVASTALLELSFLILLTSPAGIFYNFVRELQAPRPGGAYQDR